jgi:hypothetical protein
MGNGYEIWYMECQRLDLWEIGCEGVECTHVAQDEDQWRGLVNTVMNFRVP